MRCSVAFTVEFIWKQKVYYLHMYTKLTYFKWSGFFYCFSNFFELFFLPRDCASLWLWESGKGYLTEIGNSGLYHKSWDTPQKSWVSNFLQTQDYAGGRINFFRRKSSDLFGELFSERNSLGSKMIKSPSFTTSGLRRWQDQFFPSKIERSFRRAFFGEKFLE